MLADILFRLLSLSLLLSLSHFLATSPVAKKCRVDQPIRTESTEIIVDWANRTRAIGLLPILNREALRNTEILWYSQTTSLTNSFLWVLWHFFQIKHKKSYWCLPHSCSFQWAAMSRFWPNITCELEAWQHFCCITHSFGVSTRKNTDQPARLVYVPVLAHSFLYW